MGKNKAAVYLGRKSVESRHKGKNKAQISQYYKDLRQKGIDKTLSPGITPE